MLADPDLDAFISERRRRALSAFVNAHLLKALCALRPPRASCSRNAE